jgi:hypothetical protein
VKPPNTDKVNGTTFKFKDNTELKIIFNSVIECDFIFHAVSTDVVLNPDVDVNRHNLNMLVFDLLFS